MSVERTVTIRSEGHQLVGMFHVPDEATGRCIILCHGMGGHKVEGNRIFVEAARAYCAAGFSTLRFDFYGSGDSDGSFADSDIAHNISNLRDAINFVKREGATKICVMGLSLGAATAILTLERTPVEALITCSAVADFKKLFEARAPAAIKNHPEVKMYESDGWLINSSFWHNALKYEIMAAFRTLEMPKLIIQGGIDEGPFLEGFREFQMNASPPCDFYLMPGVGHTCKSVHDRKTLIRITLRWVKRIL